MCPSTSRSACFQLVPHFCFPITCIPQPFHVSPPLGLFPHVNLLPACWPTYTHTWIYTTRICIEVLIWEKIWCWYFWVWLIFLTWWFPVASIPCKWPNFSLQLHKTLFITCTINTFFLHLECIVYLNTVYYLCIIFYWILSLWDIKAAIYLLFISISSPDLQEMTRGQRGCPSHESLQLHPFFCPSPWWLRPSQKLNFMHSHLLILGIISSAPEFCLEQSFPMLISAIPANVFSSIFISLFKYTCTICFPFKSP